MDREMLNEDNDYPHNFEPFECENCGWVGIPTSYTSNENTDADGKRGLLISHVSCKNCGHKISCTSY